LVPLADSAMDRANSPTMNEKDAPYLGHGEIPKVRISSPNTISIPGKRDESVELVGVIQK
jgi:hypothetical protein